VDYRKWCSAIGLGLLLACCFVQPARADDGGVDHVTLMEGRLAPGASRVYRLKFGEGDLRQGWLFGLVGQIHSGAADLTLLGPDMKPAAQWHWDTTDAPRWDGIAIPRDGAYSLRVASGGSAELRYTLYYDQSCFCAGKKVPLEGGVVIFQGSASAGAPVEAWLAMDKGMQTHVQLAYRSAPAGRWPDDYRLLPIQPHIDTQDTDTYRQESIAFTAASADPYYLIVQSDSGTGTISFLTQEGTDDGQAALAPVASANRLPWLLGLAAAAAMAIGVLVLAARAWLRPK
jgi:hypothetical protein